METDSNWVRRSNKVPIFTEHLYVPYPHNHIYISFLSSNTSKRGWRNWDSREIRHWPPSQYMAAGTRAQLYLWSPRTCLRKVHLVWAPKLNTTRLLCFWVPWLHVMFSSFFHCHCSPLSTNWILKPPPHHTSQNSDKIMPQTTLIGTRSEFIVSRLWLEASTTSKDQEL